MKLTVLCALICCVVAACAAGAASQGKDGTQRTPEIREYPWLHLQIEPAPASVRELGIDLAELEDQLATAVRVGRIHPMPFDVTLVVTSCDEPGAHWSPQDRRITLCWEFIAAMSQGGGEAELVPGIARFIAQHEIGHALIHGLQLPVMGREEDTADSFAALFMIVGDVPGPVRAVVDAARFLRDLDAGEIVAWDEHSFGEARYYSLLCLVYGGSATMEAEVAPLIPEERANRCGAEFAQAESSWNRMVTNASE